jgi:integrase
MLLGDQCRDQAQLVGMAWPHRHHFGELSVAQFDRPKKIRPVIRQWRNGWANKPRTADYGMQVLSAVLSYAVDPLGRIAGNPCVAIKRLYVGSTRADLIWSDTDIARLKGSCAPEIGHAVDLAAHTGLRLGDLMRLTWSHIGADAIVIATGKSRGRREAVIPLYDALRCPCCHSQAGGDRAHQYWGAAVDRR